MRAQVKFLPEFGLVAPELGWVPSPSYLMRRHRILKRLRSMNIGEVLEVGCGAGALSVEFARDGHAVSALESSPQARAKVDNLAHAANVQIALEQRPTEAWRSRFSLVMAFEVLEHIEDDLTALVDWASWLAPGGYLMLSVPAHPEKWNPGDVWAGHFRRYERPKLMALLHKAGLAVETCETWGFPLTNLMHPISSKVYRSRLGKRPPLTGREIATAASGVDRDLLVKLGWLYINPLGALMLRSLMLMQELFAGTELGLGYFVVARKPIH